MYRIERLDHTQADLVVPTWIALMRDAVAHGASVGFVLPLSHAEREDYGQSIVAAIEAGNRVLLVHTAARRQGIGRELMPVATLHARVAGRTLLVLDTRSGDPSERVDRSLGYMLVGIIPGFARSPDANGYDPTSIYYQELPTE
ncbi:MAG: hypothetical protein HC876_10195 [Chloroflexaceae bacterium]|nr:hypothetical protein [Chloroflexaceae bacterium]